MSEADCGNASAAPNTSLADRCDIRTSCISGRYPLANRAIQSPRATAEHSLHHVIMHSPVAIAILPIIVMVVGAVIFAVAKTPDLKELARGAYWIGLFFTIAAFAGTMLRIG